jgi:hypothetical protein
MTLGAISGDTVSRTHWFKRPWFWVSTLVLLAGVAASPFQTKYDMSLE